MTDPIITADTVHDWERVMEAFARQHPDAPFRGLKAVRMRHGTMICVASDATWCAFPTYQWPDASPWLGITADGTRKGRA